MKFKKVVSICKARKQMVLYDGEGVQWLSDRVGAYPLFEMPSFTEVSLQRICDIGDKQWESIYFDEAEMPEGFNFGDYDECESRCKEGSMAIAYRGRMITPVHTEEGILFIDGKYLEPFSDTPERELYLRETGSGVKYFAVKLGLLIYGVIMPYKDINEEFTKSLGKVYENCRVAAANEQGQAVL